MKIGPLDSKPAATPAAADRTAPAKAQGGSAEPSAHVELSSAAKLLGTDAADGTFDAEKVARLAQAIKDGKFEVNPEAIADKLIANAQELLGKQKS
jgi:negative regulator of flagellin synthesis FlgM